MHRHSSSVIPPLSRPTLPSHRLTDVCSKRFLTTKVDRSVTGLVAQQQCVGPLLLPLADFALVATSHQDTTGVATSIGEQPYKGLIDPAAMARLAVAEALTNMAMVGISDVADIRASVNWMHAAKMGCEGSAMYMTGAVQVCTWHVAAAVYDVAVWLTLRICDRGLP